MIKPKGYYLLIEQLKYSNVSSGGILIETEESKRRQQMGTSIGRVLAMGDQCYQKEGADYAAWCEVGDVVLFQKYAGDQFKKSEYLPVEKKDDVFWHLTTDETVRAVIDETDLSQNWVEK